MLGGRRPTRLRRITAGDRRPARRSPAIVCCAGCRPCASPTVRARPAAAAQSARRRRAAGLAGSPRAGGAGDRGPPGLRPPSPFAGPTRVARRALREAAAARRERSAGPAVVPAAGPAFNVASLTRASTRAGACRTPRRFRRPRRRVPAAR